MISVPAERNTRENIAKRKVFAQEMGQILEERLVYIDESPFNLHMNRKRGRSKKGRRAYNEVKGSRGANITVLAAFSASHGLIKYIAQTGSFTQESYNAFFQELLREPSIECRSRIFLHDNASIHKSKILPEMLEGQRTLHQIKFIPPYSPHLNPIETCFSIWKSHVKREEYASRSTQVSLLNCIGSSQ